MIANIALVVFDYDEAISYFTDKLDFIIVEDKDLGGGKRWVIVSPPGRKGTNLLLAKATNEAQRNAVGNQTGGRVFLFLSSIDFWSDYERMKENGVAFIETPRVESYGTVVVFRDLYGNKWDLIQKGRRTIPLRYRQELTNATK